MEGGVDCRGVGDGTRGVGLPLATAQGVENVLGSPVLAFGEPLAYLAYDRPRHPVRFQPANQLFLAYREIDALQVALHVPPRAGGKVLPQKVHGFGPASSTCSIPAHPMIQQTRSWSDSRPRLRSSRRRRRKLLHPGPRLCRMHPRDGRLADKGRVPFGSYREGVWPERIAIGLTVFERHENVVRLLEFLGYRQEE